MVCYCDCDLCFLFRSLDSPADCLIDPPKLDLDAYIANYRGKRLQVSSTFCEVRIFNRANRPNTFRPTSPHWTLFLLSLLGSTESNAVMYLREIAPSDADAKPDLDWIDRTKKQVKSATDKMELELKGYKNNLIKESIRVCYVSFLAQAHQLLTLSKDGLR